MATAHAQCLMPNRCLYYCRLSNVIPLTDVVIGDIAMDIGLDRKQLALLLHFKQEQLEHLDM